MSDATLADRVQTLLMAAYMAAQAGHEQCSLAVANVGDVAAEVAALEARAERMAGALEKIAFKPFGPSDASHVEVLNAITDCARAAILPPGSDATIWKVVQACTIPGKPSQWNVYRGAPGAYVHDSSSNYDVYNESAAHRRAAELNAALAPAAEKAQVHVDRGIPGGDLTAYAQARTEPGGVVRIERVLTTQPAAAPAEKAAADALTAEAQAQPAALPVCATCEHEWWPSDTSNGAPRCRVQGCLCLCWLEWGRALAADRDRLRAELAKAVEERDAALDKLERLSGKPATECSGCGEVCFEVETRTAGGITAFWCAECVTKERDAALAKLAEMEAQKITRAEYESLVQAFGRGVDGVHEMSTAALAHRQCKPAMHLPAQMENANLRARKLVTAIEHALDEARDLVKAVPVQHEDNISATEKTP